MKVDIKDLLVSAGLEDEGFYPGKRIVKQYIQHGEHKSHCAVFDWHENIIHFEIKAGMNGRTLDAKELKHYPVSFQARTYMDVEVTDEDKEEDQEGSKGKSSGGGKKPAQRKLQDSSLTSLNAFSKMADGAVSTLGEIKTLVIMGREIAKEAYGQAIENLKVQLAQTKIMAMDLMKDVSDIIHKATPGGGLAPRGDETLKYKYDAERTAPMFGGMAPS
jgi:hypothetical protein